MAHPRTLIRGLDGKRIPLGASEIVLVDEHFIGKTAVPSTLTVTSGTASFQAPDNNNQGHISIMSGVTVDSVAELATAQAFPVGQYQSVRVELTGFRLDASSPAVEIGLLLNGAGGSGAYSLERVPTDGGRGNIQLLSGGESSSLGTIVYDSWRTAAEGQLRRNVSLLVSSPHREAVLSEGDSALGWRDCTGKWFDGMVTAKVQVKTKEAVSHGFRLQRIRVIAEL